MERTLPGATSTFSTISPTILTHLLCDMMLKLLSSFITNQSQFVLTELSLSACQSIRWQGCVLSHVRFSIYIQHMPNPNYRFCHLIEYADATILLELLSNNAPSTLDSAAADLANWFLSNEIVLNVGKVESLKYMGTFVDGNLKFKVNTQALVLTAHNAIYHEAGLS